MAPREVIPQGVSNSGLALALPRLSEERKQEQPPEKTLSESAPEKLKTFEELNQLIEEIAAMKHQRQRLPNQAPAQAVVNIDDEVEDVHLVKAPVVPRECGVHQSEPEPFVPPMDHRLRV